MYLHGLNSYCENNCSPEGEMRFKEENRKKEHFKCNLLPCGKAEGGAEENTEDEDEDYEWWKIYTVMCMLSLILINLYLRYMMINNVWCENHYIDW